MTLRALRFSLLVAALAAPLPALAAQSVDATLDRASAAWAKVKTVRATFEQTVTNSLTGSTASARGEFQQQRPHRLAVRFTDPAGDRIVADGKWVWIYLPSSVPGQVVKRTATDAAATPVDLTGQFLDDPHAKYAVSDGGSSTVSGRAAKVLTLVPKPGTTVPFTKATVWVDDDDALIRQFEIVEPSGITRRVRITSLETNVPVDSDSFTFSVPKGVRVVER
jgi:outer membrane lipoprotein carrier protein